jgi:hypothetical protein
MYQDNPSDHPRVTTPVSAPTMDPQLLQNMLVALTNLQMQMSNRVESPPRDPKFPDVPVFNGNKAQYAVFLAQLKNFFSLQPRTYETDARKIGYVISRLAGSAADWSVTILENEENEDNYLILNDWNAFLKAFSKFSDPFARRNATDRLLALTQSKTQSVLTYWTQFSELLYRSDIGYDSARPLFEKGLKYEIRNRLIDKDLPDDLDSYVSAVVDLDNRLYRLQKDQKSSFSYAPYSAGGSGVAPMEIGALNHQVDSKERWDEIRKMDPEERRRVCILENRCHYCKRVVGNPPAHVAQNCPFKQNKSKSDYLSVQPEVPPQTGVPDDKWLNGIPQRQVFSFSNEDIKNKKEKNFRKDITLYMGSKVIPAEVLIDSGAEGFAYMDVVFASSNNFPLESLDVPVEIKSVDGNPCGKGIITHKTMAVLELASYKQKMEFYVISSPSVPVILGWDWLVEMNPIINWKTGTMRFCAGMPDVEDGVPQRQVFVDLIHIKSLNTTAEQGHKLKEFLNRYKDVFSTGEFPKLGPHRPGVDVDLQLMEGKSPPFGPIYSLSKDEEVILRKYVEGALEAGLISKSTSPAGSPVMFVPKPDGTLRLCVDYRALNAVLKTDRTALPIIKDMLQRTKGSRVFSKIDLKSAFYLIRIKEGKEYLTAFRTKYGHYEYNVMPFGLKNAPGTFQSFMNYIFADLIDRGVLIYIDDLLVYSETVEEHWILLEEVFKRIQQYELIVSQKKCVFLATQVSFLGHVLSEKGIEMDTSKLEVIENWSFPKTVKQMRSFLGLANYYRDFIPLFSHIASPLFDLTKRNALYSETEEALASFKELKSAFRKQRVLMFPDQNSQFFLEVDASDYAIGGALHQIDAKTQKLRPIGFYSRKLSGPEQNYEIYDKELLAVIEGFKTWRYLLIGTNLPVVVYTDHRNLEYFMTAKILNRRQARWAQFLADFNFKLSYRTGETQVVADALSRMEEYYLNDSDREQNHQTLLPEHLFDQEEVLKDVQPGDRVSELDSKNPKKLASILVKEKAKTDKVSKHVKFNIPFEQLLDRKDFNIFKMPLNRNAIVSALSASSASSASSSSSEDLVDNSDYDLADYESTVEESDFDEDDLSAVGDVSQFLEFEGQTESGDPIWFRYLLQYLWYGYLPMVFAPPVLHKIKHLAKWYIFKNDRLFKKITRNQQMYHVPYIPFVDRQELIAKYHQVLGHMQVNTLLPLMEIRYYWPNLKQDLKDFQDACSQCQLNRTEEPNYRPLQPHEPVGIPFMKWGIDFVQDLPKVNGYCNIFSARCYATKRVIYIATKDRTAKTAAECIFRDIVCKYGTPVEIVSDRGFMDSTLAEYLRILEIHHLPTAAYTPRCNGLDERGHQDLKNIITKLSDGDPAKWTQVLPLAEFILNARISNSTGFSAFYLSHGFEPRLPGDEWPAVPPGYYDLNDSGDIALLSSRELARLGQNRAAALQRLKAQAIRMKTYYDKKVGVTEVEFKIGDVVKMTNHSRTRFKFKFLGPFYIVDKGPNNTFFLMRPDGRRWTSQNGTDTPVNPEYLLYFNEWDQEYYYDGRDPKIADD